MSDKDTGGSAFPHVWEDNGKHTEIAPGMTLRDYFIAHAPEKPQPWFVPAMDFKRPGYIWVGENGKHYATAREAAIECGECFTNANSEAQATWDEERDKQFYIQWPFARADAMLAERNKT